MVNVLKENLDVLKDVSRMISSETNCNIIICDHQGEIIEATQEERIGRTHMGSKIIMSGVTDEAIISPAQEEAFCKLGTDTRAGYNYAIIIEGKRVGSLGIAGNPEILKPIVRIAAKTIGIYISEYLKEKEKNKIIQKIARIAEEMREQTTYGLNYQVFTEDLLAITGAKYVLLHIFGSNDISNIVAVSGNNEELSWAEKMLGFSLVGSNWKLNRDRIEEMRQQGIIHCPDLSYLADEIITSDQAEEIANRFGLGDIYSIEIAHKDVVLGGFIIIMPISVDIKNTSLVELYTAQIGQLLMRVQAEQALKKSESKYRALVEKLNDVIFNLDQHGYIKYISPAVENILGYKPEEMLGTRLENYIYLPDRSGIKKIFKRSIKGSDETAVLRIEDKFGKIFHVRLSTRLIEQENEEDVVFGVMTDVSELKEALNILNSFWKHSPNPISILDKSGRFIRVSKSGAELLGFTPDILEGRNIADFFPAPVVEEVMQRIKGIDNSHPHIFADKITLSNGENRYYDSWIFPIADEEDTDLVGFIALDITDRKKTEERLNYLSLHDTVTGLYNRTYYEREMKRLSRSDEYPISVISLDADGLKIINDTLGHDRGDEFLKALAQILRKSLRDSDILARIGGDEFVIFLPRTDKAIAEKIIARIRKNIVKHNQENLSLPLSVSLGLETAEKPEDDLEEVLKKADENMYSNKFFQKRSSQGQILSSFMTSLEKRDYVAQGYAERLFKLFVKMSHDSKLPSGTLKALALLAQVHDLGNVTIPESILSKPGPLSEDEWKVIRLHPERGSRIAAISPDLIHIAELIIKHHERWDGKGYPLGLKGEEIPIECRILAVVDSFDAMTTEKPYRKAMTKLEALQELKRCSGTQFDPKIVDLFIEIIIEEGLQDDQQ